MNIHQHHPVPLADECGIELFHQLSRVVVVSSYNDPVRLDKILYRVPSFRNSGLETTSNLMSDLPRLVSSSLTAFRTFSAVPTGTVDLSTMIIYFSKHLPICRANFYDMLQVRGAVFIRRRTDGYEGVLGIDDPLL